MTFTESEIAYLKSQRLGRLATVAPGGAPQNNPVGFRYNPDTDTIDIYGYNMGATRKFRNVASNPMVSLVIDDIASVDPWQVRGIEVRGQAEALSGVIAMNTHLSGEIIRIHPHRVISWNVDPGQPRQSSRNVAAGDRGGVHIA
jgi:pyridoxamine 5'-phosphate oxidase family protein